MLVLPPILTPRPSPPASTRSASKAPIELPQLPSVPSARPRSVPKASVELPQLPRLESNGGAADEQSSQCRQDANVGGNHVLSQPCSRRRLRQKKKHATQYSQSEAHESGQDSEKEPKPPPKSKCSKLKKRKRKQNKYDAAQKVQNDLSMLTLTELQPGSQSRSNDAVLWRSRVDAGMEKIEQRMCELALARLAASRKASEEQRAQARAHARLQRLPPEAQSQSTADDTDQAPDTTLHHLHSAARPSIRKQARRASARKQCEADNPPDGTLLPPSAPLATLRKVLHICKPSGDKASRMANLTRRTTIANKEMMQRRLTEYRQKIFDEMIPVEKQLLQEVFTRAHNHVDQLVCRLAEFGLRGKDETETEIIQALCLDTLARGNVDFLAFSTELMPAVREKLFEGQRENLLDLFKAADKFGLNSGLDEEHCLDILKDMYLGCVTGSDFDMLKREFLKQFEEAEDPETAKIDSEKFASLFWHLREIYDRHCVGRERQIMERYGIDIDNDVARHVKDELLSLNEHLSTNEDGEICLDIVDVRGIVGILTESGLLPAGGAEVETTEEWITELAEKRSISFNDLRDLLLKVRREALVATREEVTRIFRKYDKDDIGHLSLLQASEFLKDLGLVPRSKTDQEEIRKLIDEADADGDGGIDLDEFATLVQKGSEKLRSAQRRRENETAKELQFTQQQLTELRESFFALDMDHTDQSHLLPIAACRQTLTLMRKEMSGSELNEMFSWLDRDHDGRIGFEEFLVFVKAIEDPEFDWRGFYVRDELQAE